MKARIAGLFLMFGPFLWGQISVEILSSPSYTPPKDTLFIAGDFNNWQPNATPFSKNESGQYEVQLPPHTGDFFYKITRGSWETVEGNERGESRENRHLPAFSNPVRVRISVESWEKQTPESSTATENVHLLSSDFFMPELNRNRRIWIYLPPDYENGEKSYPVIYMHDGQNLFDKALSFSEEWEIDETLNELFAKGDEGAIVIGIENGEIHRLNEYSPWENEKYGGGQGKAYLDFIKNQLKPYVDKHYRTQPEPEKTALIGSSMGGLISSFGGVAYPKTFGRIGALSPSYWFALEDFEAYIGESSKNLQDSKFYFIGGKSESKTMEEDMQRIREKLEEKGLKEVHFVSDPKGEHQESYWRTVFPQVYRWLLR